MSREVRGILAPVVGRLRPRRSSPSGLVGIRVGIVLVVFSNIENTILSGLIPFGKENSVGYANISKVFVVVYDG